jgi:hypothetical protein
MLKRYEITDSEFSTKRKHFAGSNEKMRETIVTVAKALTSSSSFRNPAGIFLFQEAKVCAV